MQQEFDGLVPASPPDRHATVAGVWGWRRAGGPGAVPGAVCAEACTEVCAVVSAGPWAGVPRARQQGMR